MSEDEAEEGRQQGFGFGPDGEQTVRVALACQQGLQAAAKGAGGLVFRSQAGVAQLLQVGSALGAALEKIGQGCGKAGHEGAVLGITQAGYQHEHVHGLGLPQSLGKGLGVALAPQHVQQAPGQGAQGRGCLLILGDAL